MTGKEQAILLTNQAALPGGLSMETMIPFVVLLAVCVVLFVLVLQQRNQIKDLDKRLKKLMRGKTASSLESEIIHLFEANDILTESAHDVQRRLDEQQEILNDCIRRAGLIKYDAFHQMGGKLSFALALLNDEGNGLILNSVHSPEGNYTYVKEVRGGKSELELGSEEQQALDRALAAE